MVRNPKRFVFIMVLGAFLFTFRTGKLFSQESRSENDLRGSESADDGQAGLFGSSLDPQGQAKNSLERSRYTERGSKEKVRFQSQLPREVTNFKLFDSNQNPDEASLESQVDSFLRQYDLDSSIEMRKISVEQKATGRRSIVYGFYINSIPIYDVFLTAHLVHGYLYFAGDLPLGSVSMEALGKELLPSSNELSKVVSDFIAREDFLFDPKVFPSVTGKPCIASANSFTFHLAACFDVFWKGTSYRGIATQTEVLEMERQSFDVTAQLSYYKKNPSVPIVTGEFEVNNSGFLENKFFATNPPLVDRFKFSPGSVVGPSGTSSPFFPEANVFAQANEMMSWFNSLGYNWDNKLITLAMNFRDDNQNNAAYVPKGYLGSKEPAILIGQGDGLILKNLSLDSDVVGHELGHHMVFRRITSTAYIEVGSSPDHSGAIHEGMADFFVYARSGEPCLGDNICPGGSSACLREATSTHQGCLRDAGLDKATYSFTSPLFRSLPPKEVHTKGMLVSGLLWDAFELSGKSVEFSKLVLNSIDYLVAPASTFDDLVTALLSSDFELFRGKYCDNIRTAAKGRGLGDAVPASCTTVGMSLKAKSSNPIMGGAQSSVVKKKVTLSKNSGCSLSSESMDPLLLSWLLMIPILSPHFFNLLRNRRLSFSRHK